MGVWAAPVPRPVMPPTAITTTSPLPSHTARAGAPQRCHTQRCTHNAAHTTPLRPLTNQSAAVAVTAERTLPRVTLPVRSCPSSPWSAADAVFCEAPGATKPPNQIHNQPPPHRRPPSTAHPHVRTGATVATMHHRPPHLLVHMHLPLR